MTNIAEILKDAPQGLKLYSMVHGEVTLDRIYISSIDKFPISVFNCEDGVSSFTKYGKMYDIENTECILFPSKEHKSWDNWQEVLFKPGNFIICEVVNTSKNQQNVCCIYNGYNERYNDYAGYFYCHEGITTENLNKQILLKNARYATPEEREQFFKELNANGYKWNADTKQIEKIEQQYTPKYTVGDWIICTDTNTNNEYFYESDEIVPHKITSTKHNKYEIDEEYIEEDIKEFDATTTIRIATEQELIDAGIKEKPFTIDDLKPFDRVLTRNNPDSTWSANYYSHKVKSGYVCVVGFTHSYCIPYNDETSKLLGTTDDAQDKYKTW